jgi:hypothetical protein
MSSSNDGGSSIACACVYALKTTLRLGLLILLKTKQYIVALLAALLKFIYTCL